jgi:hypothetical protein
MSTPRNKGQAGDVWRGTFVKYWCGAHRDRPGIRRHLDDRYSQLTRRKRRRSSAAEPPRSPVSFHTIDRRPAQCLRAAGVLLPYCNHPAVSSPAVSDSIVHLPVPLQLCSALVHVQGSRPIQPLPRRTGRGGTPHRRASTPARRDPLEMGLPRVGQSSLNVNLPKVASRVLPASGVLVSGVGSSASFMTRLRHLKGISLFHR